MAIILDPRQSKLKFTDIANIFEDRKRTEAISKSFLKEIYSKKANFQIQIQAKTNREENDFFSMVEEYCEESFPLEDNDGNNEEIDKYFKASHYLSESFSTQLSIFEFWKTQ